MKKTALLLLVLLLLPEQGYAGDIEISREKTVKIVGGSAAQPGNWPFLAALVHSTYEETLYDVQFCGGALIHERWVITAAHCVEDESAGDINVVMGINDLSLDQGERMEVVKIYIHPDYDTETLDNDIALLELASLSSFETIPLDPGGETLEGVAGTIMGWGSTDPAIDDAYPKVLQYAEVEIINNGPCNAAYSESPDYDNPITEGMICAGAYAGGTDACYGDSGGPLLVGGEKGARLAGIVSWGEGCAEPGFYGVYTRISNYTEYIGNTISTPTSITGSLFTEFAGHKDLEVIGATVALEGTALTSQTDGNGSFEIRTAPGSYTLMITAPGLRPLRKTISLSERKSLTLSDQMYPLFDIDGDMRTGLGEAIFSLRSIINSNQ